MRMLLPWLIGLLASLYCQPALATKTSPSPELPEVQSPIELDNPIVITKPGRKRLNRDCRAKGVAFVIAAPNVTIDGNGHVVTFNAAGNSDVNGIHLYVNGSWAVPDKQFGEIPGGSQAVNAKIDNLTLRQGNMRAARNNGVGGFRSEGLKINNCTIEVGGHESSTVHPQWGDITLTNNVLIARVNSTANRHQGPANVQAPAVMATNNVIIGGNSGINTHEAGSIISKNVIAQDSFATNGYGIWLYAPRGVVAKDNIILPISGRGILLNGGQPGNDTTNRGHHNKFDGNVILAREKPNAEYGESLNANGIRMRYYSTDNTVTHNYVLAVGGGDYAGASGLYLSVTQQGATSTITDNTFSTIVSGTPDANHYAKGITLEGNVDSVNYQIDRNTIQSNHMLISTSGYDGSGQLGRPMVGNALSFVDGATAVTNFRAAINSKLLEIGMVNNPWARAVVAQTFESLATTATTPIQSVHKTFYSGYYTGDEHVTLLDTKGNVGLDLTDVFVESPRYPGSRRIGIGQRSRVQAARQGKPLAERSASISTGGLTLEVWTDGQGFFNLPAIGYCLGRAGSAEGKPYTREDSQSIRITLDGVTKSIDVNAVPKVLEF